MTIKINDRQKETLMYALGVVDEWIAEEIFDRPAWQRSIFAVCKNDVDDLMKVLTANEKAV